MALINIPSAGIWSTIATAINSMFSELFTRRNYGIYNYDDAGTGISPIVMTNAETWYPLTNDESGPQTLKFPLAGISDIWSPITGAFDFSGLENGDSVDIRLDVIVITTGANQDVTISLFLADDQGVSIEIPFIVEQAFKAAGSHRVVRFNSNFLGADFTRLNQARFKAKSSSAGNSIIVNGWYCRAMPARVSV